MRNKRTLSYTVIKSKTSVTSGWTTLKRSIPKAYQLRQKLNQKGKVNFSSLVRRCQALSNIRKAGTRNEKIENWIIRKIKRICYHKGQKEERSANETKELKTESIKSQILKKTIQIRIIKIIIIINIILNISYDPQKFLIS